MKKIIVTVFVLVLGACSTNKEGMDYSPCADTESNQQTPNQYQSSLSMENQQRLVGNYNVFVDCERKSEQVIATLTNFVF